MEVPRNEGHEPKVRIHIDREPYFLANPTIGRALYDLAHISESHELYREEHGDKEDEPIRRGDETVRLHEDEHFYSAEARPREITIIVNGKPKVESRKKLTFWEVVKLAYPDAVPSEMTVYTVTYKRGPARNPEGTMVDGQTVHIKEGMIFNVTRTDRS